MTHLIDRISKTYDEVPYTSAAFPLSAPEHLRAVAHLFGLDAPAPSRARVLELGCAAGGNLIPFALRHPEADVVGIDLSPRQIDCGRGLVEAMGLTNVRLLQGSIIDLDESLGQFDYIVCPGVYSWVPEDVRAAILRVCSQRLAPDGIAYVSYNTYPGWKAKEIVRDAMLLRAGDRATAQERLAYARGMIEFLHEHAEGGSVLSTVMRDHIGMIRDGEDAYLSHEYLELCNAPCYFGDFVAAARARGLDYLGDAAVASMFARNLGEAAAPALLAECGGDQVVLEQLMDFLQNRTFRQSLLVHADRAAQIRYQITPERIAGLHLAGRYVQQEPEVEQVSRWQHSGGATVTVASPVTRAALERLNAAWPATVPMCELVAGASVEDAARLHELVVNLVIGDAVRFRAEPVVPGAMTERCFVDAGLRALATAGELSVPLSNRWHQSVRLDTLEQRVLPLLDGTVDQEALVGVVLQAVERGELQVMRDGHPLADADELAALIGTQVRLALQSLARSAMLGTMPTPSAKTAKPAAAPPKNVGEDPAAKTVKAPCGKVAKAQSKTGPEPEPKPEASGKPARPRRGK